MDKQSLSIKILNQITLLLLILAFSSIASDSLLAATPALKSLQKKYSQAQAKGDTQQLAKILRQMLDAGYKSVARYKQLGDLYFYIKKDKAALNTFREQAKWANTAKTWENLSDLLIWKKHNKEGLAALKTALSMDKNNQALRSKLAVKYEYFKKIPEAESIWKALYLSNKKSTQSGRQLIEFYLRNSLVEKAKGIMNELIQKDPNLSDSTELKVLNVKINSWLSKPEDALKALQMLDIANLPEADLGYAFDLSLSGGNIQLAEKVLDRLESLGKDVWQKRLLLKKGLGNPSETRKMIEDRIDEKGESVELVRALYETYRAERDIENQIEVLEELITMEPGNQKWHNLLLSHYIYNQTVERGIDLFQDLAEDHQTYQLIRFNLAKLYLANQDYDAFHSTIQSVNDSKYQEEIQALQLNVAYQQGDKQLIFKALKNLLQKTKNVPPEELVDPKQGKEIPDDRYLGLLTELQYLAEGLGYREEKEKFGKAAYSLVKSRYKKYPTKNRLQQILALGEYFASPDERLNDFKVGEKSLSDIGFYLKFYRYLMKQGQYDQAEELLTKMLASSKNIEDSVQVAEHTFGFVSYNFSKKLFGDIIARDPNYSMGLKRLGQIGLYTDNYQEAAFYLKKYLKVNSYDPEAIFNLGEALYYSHHPYEAEKQFERVVSLLNYPQMGNYEAILAAISHLRLENYDKALKLLEAVYKKDPTDVSIKLNILETLVLQEKWEESLDMIERENLDDKQKKQRAMELVFKANIDAENTKEDSEFKAKLKFEDLQAIVDLQLALRVNIIRHLCLDGLGRVKEDRELLENLAEKHPGNQEVIATLGYFYMDRAEDDKAKKYLEIARHIPPYDPVLNQSHRQLVQNYSTSSDFKYSQISKSSNGQQESAEQTLSVNGKIMLNELDRITYEVNNSSSNIFEIETTSTVIEYDSSDNSTETTQGTNTSEADSVDRTTFVVGYKANIRNNSNLALTHNYEIHLWLQELTGYQLKYLVTFFHPSIFVQFDLFSDLPNNADFDNIKAKTHYSGFELNSTFALKSKKQNYSLSYLTRASSFTNDNYQGDLDQTQLSLGFSQNLMTYPNNLNLNLSYSINTPTGEVAEFDADTSTTAYKHFSLPYSQIHTSVSFSRNWSEFLSNSFNLSMQTGDFQEYKTDNKTTLSYSSVATTYGIEFNYLKDRWSLLSFFNYSQETTGEKTEITTSGVTTTTTIAEEKVTTFPELGLAVNYLF